MAVEAIAKEIAPVIYPGDRPRHILIAQQFSREWLQEDRPDFLWQQGRAQFSGLLQDVGRIYQASVGR